MPLQPGSSRAVIGNNIREMQDSGHPHDQAVAAALSNARRHPRADGGTALNAPFDPIEAATHIARQPMQGGGMAFAAPWFERQEARDIEHTPYGFSMGTGGGRHDKNNVDVGSGSYVIPADVVSGLGEGNSLNGAKVWDSILHTMPYGIAAPQQRRGMGPPHPPHDPMLAAGIEEGIKAPPISPTVSRGGAPEPQGGEKIPIVAADGEVIVSPDDVRRIGQTYFPPNKKATPEALTRHGHDVLDAMVKEVRGRTIKKLKDLPGPVGSKEPLKGHR